MEGDLLFYSFLRNAPLSLAHRFNQKNKLMKQLLAAGLLAMGFFTSNAQHVDIGVHGGYGTTWLINDNVSDQGPELDPETSFGSVFGVHAGFYAASRIGIVVEVN